MNTILPIDKHGTITPMEEFVGQENKNIYEALTSGIHSVEWPGHCRNCEWTYSEQMKKEVVKRMLGNPMIDFLRIVSDVFKSSIPENMKIRYCCINNFRPRIERKFIPEEARDFDPGKRYRVFSETLVIEEGLEEWYNVTWSLDEADILEEARKEVAPLPEPRVGVEMPCHFHGQDRPPVSLFDILDELVV